MNSLIRSWDKIVTEMINSKEIDILPKGWRREEVMRKNGLSTGKTEVFYVSPDGMKIRTKCQLARWLGNAFDSAGFDFRTGKYNPLIVKRSRHHRHSLSSDGTRTLRCGDTTVSAPLRRTASIFKQPVTVIKTQQESNVREDLKHGPPEKPKQLFWEKRLEGLKATVKGKEGDEGVKLPKIISPVGPHVTPETALRSLSTALHLHFGPIVGQTAGKNLEKNPVAYLDPDQPLIGTVMISDEAIKRQEERVFRARHKLASAINEYELG